MIGIRVQRRTLRIRLRQRFILVHLLTGFCGGKPFQINTGRLCALWLFGSLVAIPSVRSSIPFLLALYSMNP